MFRLTLAFGLLFSLALGCGGSAPGTGAGGDTGNSGTTMREVSVDSPDCVVQPEPNACIYEVADRTQSETPIMEFKTWAADCSRDIANLAPIAGTEHSVFMLEDLRQITSLMVPNQGKINVVGKLTFSDKDGTHEWTGGTGCRDITTIDPLSRLPLLLGQRN